MGLELCYFAFLPSDTSASAEPIICPSCSSDHVVVLPCERGSSTSLPPQDARGESQQEAASEKLYIGDDNNSDAGTSSSMQIQELSGEHSSAAHSSSRSSEGGEVSIWDLPSKNIYTTYKRDEPNGSGLLGSYRYSSRGTTPSQLSLSTELDEPLNMSPRE